MVRRSLFLASAVLVAAVSGVRAQVSYSVSFNTTPLLSSGLYTAPFSLDVQFFDGGGTGPEPKNVASFSNFTGQTGSIAPFSVSDGFPPGSGEQVVNFTPGSTLSFNVSMTTNEGIESPGPDVLSLLMLDNDNTIATTDPSGGNTFVTFTESTDPANPQDISTATYDAASGPLFTPIVSSGIAPEPEDFALLTVGALTLCVSQRRRH